MLLRSYQTNESPLIIAAVICSLNQACGMSKLESFFGVQARFGLDMAWRRLMVKDIFFREQDIFFTEQ
eukprot:c8477_g1_i1 orf=22-225(+)